QLSILLNYYQAGQYVEAETLANSIIQQFPMHEFSWKVLGASLKQNGKNIEALTAMKKSLELAPKDSEAHNNLGVTLEELGRLKEAEVSYRKAIKLKSNYSEAHNNLGNILKEFGRLEEAEVSYRKAVKLKSDFVEAYNNLGVTLKESGRLDEAEVSYRKAIKLKFDYAEAYNNLGNLEKDLGKFDKAKSSYLQAIALKPDYAEAHRSLALMKKFKFKDEQFSKMRELYFDKNLSKEQLCHINFGLAKACEDLEDYEEAFIHYSEGNKIRKKLLNYDISYDIKLFNKIKLIYDKIYKNSLEHSKSLTYPTPIFIVGMPRSGSTLVEQIISSHSKVKGGGELIFAEKFGREIATGTCEINQKTIIDFQNKYLTKLKNISDDKSFVTDKMPHNFRYLGLLVAAFPSCKIIHVKRNPVAVCWANYKQYFVSKNLGYCYSIDDIINYHKLYENLMEFWFKNFSKRIYNLNYELLTTNQENEIRKLISYIGLDWDEKCLFPQDNKRVVATASNLQIREKIYQGSSQQWKKYQKFLNGAFDNF
ncbi:tetratricopeptide repeat protein, partial [Alphaproteobacteria bacterium]|nr:tetratricopeptide repeat protein [Alphaproteobacteria bacterium]